MGVVTYLDLPLPHDLVHDLVVVLVEHAFVITLLVAQDTQVLGALQLNFKLLSRRRQHRRKENEWPAEAQGISMEHKCLSDRPRSTVVLWCLWRLLSWPCWQSIRTSPLLGCSKDLERGKEGKLQTSANCFFPTWIHSGTQKKQKTKKRNKIFSRLISRLN